jgi:RHS repeat-associated protein
MTYEPTNTGEKYLVGLQASQTVTNSSYVLQSKTLNLYDGATNSTNTAAKVGKLTAVRTWVAGNNYDQISYGYNDRWGNRTYVTTYKTNATDIADPTDTGYTTTTTFDSTYGTYPVVQTNAKNQSVVTYYDCTLGLPTSQSNLFRTVQAAPQNACTETPGFSADLSQTSRAKYDAFGRMTALSKPGESDSTPSFTVEYADTIPFTAKLAQKVDEQTAGTTWAYSTRYYDGMGRQYKTETSGAGVDTQWAKTLLSVTTTSFDADGHPTSQSTPYINAGDARYTTTSYDVLGRPQTVTAPDNTPTHYYYNTEAISVADANGNATWTTDVASVTDGIGHTTTTIKDVWGNTIQVISPVKDIITKEKIDPGASYAYDVLGRLTDAKRGNTKTHMDYDGAGHKIDMHDPDMGSWNYWYDSQGNLTTQKDARGCTISLNYDELSRLINKSDCNTLVVIETYNYDEPGHSYLSSDDDYSIGHRTSMATSGTTTSTNWFYDVRGQMRKEDKVIYVPVGGQPVSQSFETKFDYNDAGLLTSTTYPDNEVVTTRYDSRMLLYSAASDPSHDSTQYVISTDYDLASRILSQTYGNGMQTKWNYNPWDTQGGRLHNVTTKSSTLPLVNGPTTIQNLTYAYDPLGNINTITDDSRNQTQAFRYDALNRLTCASAGVSVTPAPTCNPNTDSGSDANGIYNQNYGYDPGTGNLTSKGGQSYTYDPSHPHAVSALGNNTYNYDPNGNQTTRTVNGKRYSLGYDAEGRLVSVNAQAGAQSQSLLRSNPLPAATSTTLAPVTPTATPTTSVLKTATARPSGTPTPAVTSTRTASATATKTPQTGGQAPAANVFQAAYKQKAALIISTAPVTPIPVATALSFHPVTSWTFDTTVQGWAGSSTDVSGFGWRSGGYIGASIIGNDPLIYSAAGLNVNITNNPYIRISYKNTTPSNIATFYYMTGSDTGFTLAKYKSFIVYPNSDYTTYLVDMSTVASWTGTLTRLRFDPAGTYSGSFGVDYIQIGYVTIVTLTPTNTPTPITPTLTPTKTPTPITPTLTPTRTSTLTDTPTKTLTLTLTPTDTPTKTLTPTLTPTKTPTDTPTDTPTKTLTPTLTPTKTLTPTLTPTDTQTKTLTPTVMPTDTPTPTPTPVPFSATFTYDADGNMASATMNGVTTLYVSTSYQVQVTGTDSVVTKYYPGGAFSVGGVLYYALTDQVGSTTAVVSATSVMETRYDAWGQVRYADDKLPTDRTYTGQRSYMGDASTGAAQGFGLMYYNARWYDPYITHFSQPDSIIPDGVQGYDRYAYANNNPIMHSDPSGHWAIPLILIGVAIVGVVALTAGAILYATNPEARRSIDGMAALTGQGIAAAQSKMQTDASITVLAVDVLLAKAKPPKPLTPDEQDKIKHIGEDTEPFLDKHPDAGAEAAKKAAGEDTGEYDHANELDEFMRGVQNDMDHLESVRPFRDAESQAAIDNALNQGQDWVQRARKILGMD